MSGTEKNIKEKRKEKLGQEGGWMEGKEIDVLSLHLQPQKHQVRGVLRWSGSSSELLQPRLKHTHTYTQSLTATHTNTRTHFSQCVACEHRKKRQLKDKHGCSPALLRF
ncbi:hypothetical protein XENOCAPTIV_028989 [Xenoophorus captivus]|uniref:Uncharacterized protein n=1 Tax=Xenoophorus captivus TaxID=1517983 RepID=A0ABV0QBW6_9TELE